MIDWWIGAGLLVFLGGFVLHIVITARKVSRELRAAYGEPVRSAYVQYDGLESLGGRQWRGLSLLWLTRGEIVLVRLSPRKQIVIPLEAVLDVYTSRVYNGQIFIFPWLYIRFIRDDGRGDVIGFMPLDHRHNEWARQIRNLRKSRYGL